MGDTASDVAQTVQLVPDESITDAIGRGHTLATAAADIIDNSLDHNAERVVVRFVVEDDRLVAIRIRDDGSGMTPQKLLDAMTLGKRSQYGEEALGHFGIGLKAASLSQALTLTVFTRSAEGPPCAMRITRGSFTGHVLDQGAAELGYSWDARGPLSTGTVVEWSGLEAISHSQLASERRSWLDRTITGLSHSLGLTFHRLIQLRGIRLMIDTWDRRAGTAGPPRIVEPRDPFQFAISGMNGYPAVIGASTTDGARLEAECFILPPRSDSPSAWLLGRNPVEWQGLYIYRHDRLLQAGGWLDVRPDDKRLRLARVRINLNSPLERHLRLRHEKSGVTPTQEFSAALEAATNRTGLTLDAFRLHAREVLRASNVRTSAVKPVVPLGVGVPERVIEAVREELGERSGDSVCVEWEMLGEDKLFEMQLEQRRIAFNLGYRAALGGNEVALVPTLVYLLLENYFTRDWLRDSTKAQIDAWQKVATAAMLAQLGDDAYDPLANWDAELAIPASRTSVGPMPSPPSVQLRWAHLGQRGMDSEPGRDDYVLDSDFAPEQLEIELAIRATQPADVPLVEEKNADRSADPPHDMDAFVAPSDQRAIEGEPAIEMKSEPISELVSPATRQKWSAPAPVHAKPGDREIVVLYRSGLEIDAIASTIGAEPHAVAMRLCALLLDLEGADVDDENLAAMHGQPYTPHDREKILEMYRGGASVRRIAERLMRTPFAIGWQLLSSPKHPVEVPRRLIRQIDRALVASAGTPAGLSPSDGDAG